MDIRRLIAENWPIKLASFVLALTLWFYVTSKGKAEISLTVPLELRNAPQGMAVVGNVPGTIEVRLQGQERALRDTATAKQVVGSVDLGAAREGENRLHLSPDDIRKPAGVAVTYLAPAEIDVRLERVVQRSMRVQAVVQGRPAPGYRYMGATVKPYRLTLEGPSSVIRAFTTLQTQPIDIEGAKGPVTSEPRIDYQGKPVKILEQDITVTVIVEKERS
jgi:YbbR domain-containing protein